MRGSWGQWYPSNRDGLLVVTALFPADNFQSIRDCITGILLHYYSVVITLFTWFDDYRIRTQRVRTDQVGLIELAAALQTLSIIKHSKQTKSKVMMKLTVTFVNQSNCSTENRQMYRPLCNTWSYELTIICLWWNKNAACAHRICVEKTLHWNSSIEIEYG